MYVNPFTDLLNRLERTNPQLVEHREPDPLMDFLKDARLAAHRTVTNRTITVHRHEVSG